jgi:hypothetical protein
MIVTSDTPIALPSYSDGALGQVECLSAPASVFARAMQGVRFDPRSDPWYRYAFLEDGSTYVRWDRVGEFLVSADGSRITCRQEEASSDESFQVYMLGQALSFALVKQGFEPLHATVVVVNDQAVAFLGDHAFGKSTLAACFLHAGHRLLTDDLLIFQESSRRPRVSVHHGSSSFRWPPVSRQTMDRVPMNVDTNKLILPIGEPRRCVTPVLLKAIYSLAAPREASRSAGVSVETLSLREAFVELVKATFNRRVVSAQRLERQFGVMAGLTGLVSLKKLTYPRSIDRLQEVREAVIGDLGREARID